MKQSDDERHTAFLVAQARKQEQALLAAYEQGLKDGYDKGYQQAEQDAMARRVESLIEHIDDLLDNQKQSWDMLAGRTVTL